MPVDRTSDYDYCNFTDSIKALNEKSYWAAYAVLMPCYFVFGMIGRSVSLLAFYHQAKVEPAYLFQIFVAVIELVTVLSYSFYAATRYLWSGIAKLGEDWFMKCWFCMYVDAHISNPFQMAAIFCSLMLSLCMTLDRIYAMAKPLKYAQRKNRKKDQWAIFVFCIFFSMLAAFADVFYFMPEWNEGLGMYTSVHNVPWRTFLLTLVNVQVMIKLAFTVMLAVCDLILAVFYRVRIRKKVQMTKNKEKEAEEMEKVRVLFWLTFIQSTLDSISSAGDFAYNFISWLCEVFHLGDNDCLSTIMSPFTDGAKALADMSNFYIMFALMPSFRKMVIRSVRRTFRIGNNEVTDVSKSGMTRSTIAVSRSQVKTITAHS